MSCGICFDAPASYMFDKCRHLIICGDCSELYSSSKHISSNQNRNSKFECCLCRTPGDLIKIYTTDNMDDVIKMTKSELENKNTTLSKLEKQVDEYNLQIDDKTKVEREHASALDKYYNIDYLENRLDRKNDSLDRIIQLMNAQHRSVNNTITKTNELPNILAKQQAVDDHISNMEDTLSISNRYYSNLIELKDLSLKLVQSDAYKETLIDHNVKLATINDLQNMQIYLNDKHISQQQKYDEQQQAYENQQRHHEQRKKNYENNLNNTLHDITQKQKQIKQTTEQTTLLEAILKMEQEKTNSIQKEIAHHTKLNVHITNLIKNNETKNFKKDKKVTTEFTEKDESEDKDKPYKNIYIDNHKKKQYKKQQKQQKRNKR
jgi:hypothetical protein